MFAVFLFAGKTIFIYKKVPYRWDWNHSYQLGKELPRCSTRSNEGKISLAVGQATLKVDSIEKRRGPGRRQ
jgi:hypothetical protein